MLLLLLFLFLLLFVLRHSCAIQIMIIIGWKIEERFKACKIDLNAIELYKWQSTHRERKTENFLSIFHCWLTFFTTLSHLISSHHSYLFEQKMKIKTVIKNKNKYKGKINLKFNSLFEYELVLKQRGNKVLIANFLILFYFSRWRISMVTRYHAWPGHCQSNICLSMCLHQHR